MSRRHPAPLLYCPHGRPAFNEPDCPQCVQEQYERWRDAKEARLDPDRYKWLDDFIAWVKSDPAPHESEVPLC